MRIDGRTLSHETSETIRRQAVQRVKEHEVPSQVIKGYGLCRTTIYKWLRAERRRGGPHGAEASGAPARPDAAPEAAGAGLDQWQRPPPVRLRLWLVDPADCGGADCGEVRRGAGRDRRRAPPRRVGHHAAETLAARLRARSRGDRALDDHRVPPPARPGQTRRREDLLPG